MINLRLFSCPHQVAKSYKQFFNTQEIRNYVIKRKFPINRSLEEQIPVKKYPLKDENANLVYVWGVADHGALGYFLQFKHKSKKSLFATFNKPLRLTFAEVNRVTDVAAGYGFTAFAVSNDKDYKLFGTGINTDSQIGYHDPRKDNPLGLLVSPAPIYLPIKKKKCKILNMSAGRAHLVVNTEEGVFTLGNNAYGQCGRSIVADEKYIGSRVVHHIENLDGNKIVNVECGQDHTLFLTENGSVYSCGWGADGQTGQGHYKSQGVPSKVIGDIEGEKIVKLSSAADCILALSEKGDVFGWGNSEYSQLLEEGDDRQQINTALFIKKCKPIGKIIDVAAAGSYCLALNDKGEVYSWGYGILGRGPEVIHSWQPELIPPVLFGRNLFEPDSVVTSIYCGINFSAAITNHGNLYMWGKNSGACLGLGHEKDQFFPLQVSIGARALKMSLGVDHSIAICRHF